MPDTEHKRRIVRGLLDRTSRGFAEECGFPVTNNPAKLFQLLYLSVLLSGPRDHRQAVRTAQALRDRDWDTARALAASLHRDRVAVLTEAGERQDVDQLASTLGDLAKVVLEDYRGDLRRLRAE